MTPVDAVRQFVACINAGDVPGVTALMAPDHRFVDAGGAVHPGKEAMSKGWVNFLASFPDYRIDLDAALTEGDTVAAFGEVSGSFQRDPAKAFRVPAAFRAVVRDGLIAEWRVYADIEPMARAAGVNRFDK